MKIQIGRQLTSEEKNGLHLVTATQRSKKKVVLYFSILACLLHLSKIKMFRSKNASTETRLAKSDEASMAFLNPADLQNFLQKAPFEG